MEQDMKNDETEPHEASVTDEELQVHSQGLIFNKQQGAHAPSSPPTGPHPFLPSCVCSVCEGIGELSYEKLHEIEAAAARGCHWCSMFSQAIRRAYPSSTAKNDFKYDFNISASCLKPDGLDEIIKLYFVEDRDRVPNLLTDLSIPGDEDWMYPMSCDKYSKFESSFITKEYPVPRKRPLKKCDIPLCGNDGSARSVDQALKWFNKCRDTHLDCGPSDLSFCPSRLLELGTSESDASDTLQVKLIETKHFRTSIAYACLSHCWGGIEPACITKKDTIHANSDGISWTEIPRTFQEAMVVAWRLGLQYIWIDSLCIVQDDEEDWRKEAENMARIYSNSSITIAATSSANCHQGLYRTDLSHVKVDQLEVLVSNRPPARVLMYVVSGGVDWTGYRAVKPRRTDPKRPLLERAWFFQEWHLSPRLLHFNEGEIIWQCRCGSLSQYEAFEGRLFPHPAAKQVEDALPFEEGPHGLTTPNHWFEVVEAYTSLKLSFREKDILAAISGVAKKTVQFKLGDTYAAGIWLEHLYMGLCWQARWPSASGRLREWAAPSWSWASVDGPVRYETHFYDAYELIWDKKCVISDVTCILAGEDATGPLKDASLTVSGPATRCTLDYGLEDRKVDGAKYSINMGQNWCLLSPIDFAPDYALNQPGDHHLAPGSSLVCLLLLRYHNYLAEESDRPTNCWSICLILTECKSKKGAYERIGLLEIQDYQVAAEMDFQCDRSTLVIV